jgi:hypothetical protein
MTSSDLSLFVILSGAKNPRILPRAPLIPKLVKPTFLLSIAKSKTYTLPDNFPQLVKLDIEMKEESLGYPPRLFL